MFMSSGPIPTLPDSVKFLDVSGNRLSMLPPVLPASLEVLDVSGNGLSGTISPIRPSLVRLALDNNKLTGTLPVFDIAANGRRRLVEQVLTFTCRQFRVLN